MSLKSECAAAGIDYAMVRNRIGKLGWPKKRAFEQPKRADFNCIAAKARAVGLSQFLIYSRLEQGWTLKRAMSTPKRGPKRSYDEMIAASRGCPPAARPMPDICELSGEPRGDTRLVFDHDEGTKTHRGWIKKNYNSALGLFKHDPKLLRRAADYLEKHSA